MSISVVLATYNGEKYLDTQLRSILVQSFKPEEIIVCDDCSTDGTVSILQKYQQSGQLKYIVNDQRLGVIENFKKAVSLAKKENYLALCDQDDEWFAEKLKKSVAALNSIDQTDIPCISYSDLVLIDKDDKILNASFWDVFGFNKYHHNPNTLVYTNFVTGCTVLMNPMARKWFENMPHDVRSHDEWLALIAFTFGKAIGIDEPLVMYRKHDNNVSLPEDFKPVSRYKAVVDQLKKVAMGEDDFLKGQFKSIQKFYTYYQSKMPGDKVNIYETFLKLYNKSYYNKKLNYRNMLQKNRR